MGFQPNNKVTAKDITNNNTVNNKGNLATDNLTNNQYIDNKGKLVVNDDLNNNGNIKNLNELTAGNLNNKGTVENNGKTTLNGNSNNNGDITGNGTLTNNGNINNKGTISQNKIENNGEITSPLEKLITTGGLTNNGQVTLTGGGITRTDITGGGNGVVNIKAGKDNIIVNNKISDNIINFNSGTMLFSNAGDISNATALNLNGGNFEFRNGATQTHNLGNVNVHRNTKMNIDFDPMTATTDKFNGNFKYDGGLFVIDKVSVINSKTLKNYIHVHLGDTTGLGRNNIKVANRKLPSVMNPIYLMDGDIKDGFITYKQHGSDPDSFNPSVLASPVAALVGGVLTQQDTLQNSFYHADTYFKYPHSQRLAAENINRYAYDGNTVPTWVKSPLPETEKGMWVKPYTTFERVGLKGGVDVSNTAYGALYGGDSELKQLKNGYKGVVSAFVGYNGSHQTYNGISMNQQGGTLGVTGTLYKGNFFTAMTMSAGASAGEAYTQYGRDQFAMMTAGVASKSGYNWELKDGKFIVQSTLYVGYTFANTFDYQNVADLDIKSDSLHSIQVAPGVKVIGNFKNGWQPYASVDMVMNFMGKTSYMANDVKLPELSVRPYVQYGVGVQKSWGDRFTGYGAAMIRNGGRNGLVLQAGFRWAIGKDYHDVPEFKPSGNKGLPPMPEQIKQELKDNGILVQPQKTSSRKAIKQLSDKNIKSKNTTMTQNRANVRKI